MGDLHRSYEKSLVGNGEAFLFHKDHKSSEEFGCLFYSHYPAMNR